MITVISILICLIVVLKGLNDKKSSDAVKDPNANQPHGVVISSEIATEETDE